MRPSMMPIIQFDVKTFCENLRATKPPYECPVKECGKIYKSLQGMEYHLYNYDHNNPEGNGYTTPIRRGSWRKSRGGGTVRRSPSPVMKSPQREALTYAQAQRLVEVDIKGHVYRLDIFDYIDVVTEDEFENEENEEQEKHEKTPTKTPKVKSGKVKGKESLKQRKEPTCPPVPSKLPEASYKLMKDYEELPDAPKRGSAYFRFIEKSQEELDEDVEYDMDEEDYAWLDMINEKRKKDGHSFVPQEIFETLMDRLEKESYFQSQASGKSDTNSLIDEDAVCSICQDGECQNSNVILFCDMCNLAVHQECYGVPYIPEGQWLCRRCLQSPSRAVDCVLCPNKGGAFKQTDDSRWAHVVCALWIPEVGFANTVFLEPVDGIDHIPAARWKLTCYICKQRNVGACIQCHKANCYTAFHVTCAQQASLFMKMEPVREPGINGTSISIRKAAFCDIHTPAGVEKKPVLRKEKSPVNEDVTGKGKGWSAKKAKAQSRKNMRKARKILAEKRSAMPVVSIPCIPPKRISKITSKVNLPKKQQFMQRLLAYWTLKRQSRNGVSLLRRLQAHHQSHKNKNPVEDKKVTKLKEHLKYWQRLRHDLERARLLVELIRKREKLKKEHLKLSQRVFELQLKPLNVLLLSTLSQLQEKDLHNIFAEPVTVEEAPDYYDVIKKPVDFSTMRKRLENHKYHSVTDLETDFEQMIDNCMLYNGKETVFYRDAVKMRDQGGAVIRQAKRLAEKAGYHSSTGMHTVKAPEVKEVEEFKLDDFDNAICAENREHLPLEDQLNSLLEKLDMTCNIKSGLARAKRVKQLRKEINIIRRKITMQRTGVKKGPGIRLNKTKDDTSADSTSEAHTSGDELSDVPTRRHPASPPTLKPAPILNRSKSSPGRPGRGRPKGSPGRRTRTLSGQCNSSQDLSIPPTIPEFSKFQEPKSPVGRKSPCARRASEKLASPKSPKSPKPSEKLSSPKQVESIALPKTPAKLISPGRRHTVTIVTPSPRGRKPGKSPGRKSMKRSLSLDVESQRPVKKLNSEDNLHVETEYEGTLPSPAGSPKASKKSGRTLSSSSTEKSHDKKSSMNNNSELSNGLDEPVKPKGFSFFTYRVDTNRPRSSSDSDESVSSTSDGLTSETCSSHGEEGTSKKPKKGNIHEDSDGEASCEESTSTVSRANRAAGLIRAGKTRSSSWASDEDDIPLNPLDLVWAKCRGYPSYPALIINPRMPRVGFTHNGVPIPVPPLEVLNQKVFAEEHLYLVLFFDNKRTWQWLPRAKLEPLGVDSGLDQAKLTEGRTSAIRKSVGQAYDRALFHRRRVTGEVTEESAGSDTSMGEL
ncbi:bromodomain-containing protein 1-like [Anneissia japonica]|uniref:bromodomain-containing protein 1-like n=1 Tax=Anneissia japonica TaxID=1529436 RepID=UPI0014257D95|nr:bromodomain-containing protein 1-like [Anneissia japonica]